MFNLISNSFTALSVPRGSETSRLLRRQQLMDRHAQALEFERSRRLAQLQLVREHYQQQQQQQQHYLFNSMNALKFSAGPISFPN